MSTLALGSSVRAETHANATGETDRPVKALQDDAIPARRSAFEQLRSFLHGCDYVLDVMHTVGEETGWHRFRDMV